MSLSVVCGGCGSSFEAERSTAKWCSDRCRRRVSRAVSDSPAESDSTPVAEDSGYEHPLVRATRADLESAGQVGTVQSELALVMAKRLTDPDETGFSSLAKEFRVVLAEALGVELGAPESDPAESDEVAKARQAREQARQAAGL